jgi:predicted outer membrane repeat protein
VALAGTLLWRINARFQFSNFVNNTAQSQGAPPISVGSSYFSSVVSFAEGGAIFATGNVQLELTG